MSSTRYVHGFGLFGPIPFVHGFGFIIPNLPFDFWEGVELGLRDGMISSEEMFVGQPHTRMNEGE